MKIALLVPAWPPGHMSNGIVTYASQIVPALRELGHEVFVLTENKAADENDSHTIDLRRYASSPTLWDGAVYRLAPSTAIFKRASTSIAEATAELVNKNNLDIIEMEESYGWNFAISQLKLLPVVVRLHGPWFLTGRFADANNEGVWNRGRDRREGIGLDHAQLVTAPSAALLDAVKRHYGLELPTSVIIRNSLQAAPEAETWNFNNCDDGSLLFVGRFDSLKGGDLVLHAFAELARNYPQSKLTFVGPDLGIRTHGKTVAFEEFVQTSLPDWCRARINFCGQMDRSDVMSLRRKHCVTIIASQYEMMPYSILEAMSLGCPLVATEVGGIPDLIQDRRNGLLVAPNNVNALVAACKRLLDNHEFAARLGRQAWCDCRELHAPDMIAKQTVVAYQSVIDQFRSLKN